MARAPRCKECRHSIWRHGDRALPPACESGTPAPRKLGTPTLRSSCTCKGYRHAGR